MAGIRAEEVSQPREVRAYGLTPGIGGADAIGWISTLGNWPGRSLGTKVRF